MKASEIGDDGVWRKGKIEVPLLGAQIPIPEQVKPGDCLEEGLYIVEAPLFFDYCPKCEAICDTGIIIVMETIRMFPAHCCDTILWFVESDEDDMDTYE